MKTPAILKFGLILAFGAWLGGCTALKQPSDVVLIRQPGNSHYDPPVSTMESARRLWTYAILSSNVYHGVWQKAQPKPTETPAVDSAKQITAGEAQGDDLGKNVKACLEDPSRTLHLGGWEPWADFPSVALKMEAEELGLYLEVWESTDPSPTIAVVFKGTEFKSRADWLSNLHGLSHLIPGYKDQYTLLSTKLGQEFVDELAHRHANLSGADGKPLRIVATGHSLGGGLAQFFAYSLPAKTSNEVAVPRIANVYAFDPSPVTGWYSVGKDLRTQNIEHLKVDRVFEHGEILAYVRLLLGYINPPPSIKPAVTQTRYNFKRSGNILASHSILRLACEMAFAKNGTPDSVARK